MKTWLSIALALFSAGSFVQCQQSLTSSAPSNSLPSSSTLAPSCLQSRSPSDPAATAINQAVKSDGSVGKACNAQSPQKDTAASRVYYALGNAYFFNHTVNSTGSTLSNLSCQDAFGSIFTACVLDKNFWGGWIVTGGTNFSSTRFDYPWDVIY